MSSRTIRQWLTGSLPAFLILVGTVAFSPLFAQTQSAQTHEELRMSITGTVKVLVVVAPNGNLKSTKVVGGHPLLVNAAMDAIKKWKFEPAPEESTGIVEAVPG